MRAAAIREEALSECCNWGNALCETHYLRFVGRVEFLSSLSDYEQRIFLLLVAEALS